MSKKAVVIGAGFSGLSAACFLAKQGWQVTLLEKHSTPGGRARSFETDGFCFDMGPSWYWMPDVFERFFNQFGKKVSDYYSLKRLDPSYRVYWPEGHFDIPASYDDLRRLFENTEPGAAIQLDQFLKEAAYKYETGINKLVHKPGRSLLEFMDADVIKGVFKLDVFSNMRKHVARFFKDQRLRQLMEFPVLFLGAEAKNIPALYSLMNYADIKLGTWFPEGGMYKIVDAMYQLALSLGVNFHFSTPADRIELRNNLAAGVWAGGQLFEADTVVSGADYHFTETQLLDPAYRNYSEAYWEKRVMAPSCLLYYVGLNRPLENLPHHSLFFDTDFETHAQEIYRTRSWPRQPLFYVSRVTATDPSLAPPGCDNLFFLIPVAAGLKGDNEEIRKKYFNLIAERVETRTGYALREHIIYSKSFSVNDFVTEYGAFKGNAYGLANTLRQTAVLKPACKNKKIKNLYYTGQLTVPGPGVPPSLISGEVVANLVEKEQGSSKN